jgi:hypothetical protein
MCTHRITESPNIFEYIRLFEYYRISAVIREPYLVQQWTRTQSNRVLVILSVSRDTADIRWYSMIRCANSNIESPNHRITESWANRQIFAVPNHRITEYRILENLSHVRSIEYRVTESIWWPNIEPWFDDSIFGHRISNTSNHRIFDDSVSLLGTGN